MKDFNAEHQTASSGGQHSTPATASDRIKLYDGESYTAYTEDLEFMWRWTIYRDQKLVQEGCSLTLDASRHAVGHVLACFGAIGRQYSPGVSA